MHGTGNKRIKPKTQKQSEENIIQSIRNLFKLKNVIIMVAGVKIYQ